jgi:hypothetical protein
MDTLCETPTHDIIFEFKTSGTPEDALAQIDASQYAAGLERPVVKVGVVFDLEKKEISAWAVQTG